MPKALRSKEASEAKAKALKKALNAKFWALSSKSALEKKAWESGFSEENVATARLEAIQDGPGPMPAVDWSRVLELIEKLQGVEKEGQKIYKKLKEVPTKSMLGERQLTELEDGLMHVDDEKHNLIKVYTHVPSQERSMSSCFESIGQTTIRLYVFSCKF